ncbi:MAG: hypothetical protein ACE5HX_00920 [bacterium]
MDDENILLNLEELVEKLTLELRYEKGDFVGGLYRYNNKEQIIINKDLNTKQKINVLANELKVKVNIENLYLVPALREVIEHASSLA